MNEKTEEPMTETLKTSHNGSEKSFTDNKACLKWV